MSRRKGEQTPAWVVHVQVGNRVLRGKEARGLETGKVGKDM